MRPLGEDPCSTCLIKPCCKEECTEKICYDAVYRTNEYFKILEEIGKRKVENKEDGLCKHCIVKTNCDDECEQKRIHTFSKISTKTIEGIKKWLKMLNS